MNPSHDESNAGRSKTAEEQAFYDDMWRKYAHLDAVSPAAIHRRRQVLRVAEEFAPNAKTILDVGCGQGELLRDLAPHFPGAKIMGADISEQSIADSRKLNPTFELFTIDLVVPDFEKRYAQYLGKSDLVICSEVVEHIDEAALAVTRLRLLAAPGGTIVVTVPGGRMSKFDVAIGHKKHYTTSMLRGLLSGAVLEVLTVRAWGFPFHSIYREAVRIASRFAVGDPAPKEKEEKAGLSALLGKAYTLFGKGLTPLFYLNLSRWGEQMISVARRPA
jgi:2-polyprenyl-3-methyl-5-hydroxy-6-metoxy-1,4-benzoquinol methylase